MDVGCVASLEQTPNSAETPVREEHLTQILDCVQQEFAPRIKAAAGPLPR